MDQTTYTYIRDLQGDVGKLAARLTALEQRPVIATAVACVDEDTAPEGVEITSELNYSDAAKRLYAVQVLEGVRVELRKRLARKIDERKDAFRIDANTLYPTIDEVFSTAIAEQGKG